MRHRQVRAAPPLMPNNEATPTSSPTLSRGSSAPSKAEARTERALSGRSPIRSATRARRSSTAAAGTSPLFHHLTDLLTHDYRSVTLVHYEHADEVVGRRGRG